MSKSADPKTQSERNIGIVHAGEKTFYSKDEGDFIERTVIECRCDTEEEARGIGKLVSLLNEGHDPDRVTSLVELADQLPTDNRVRPIESADDWFPTECVLCDHSAETPEEYEEHMEEVHDAGL